MNRALVPLAFASLFACATPGASAPASPPAAAEAPAAPAAQAFIEGRSGSALTGTARFTEQGSRLVAHVTVANAAPGLHGVHIHEVGDCSDSKAASAGGHFNPGGSHHGGPETEVRHGGDLGNLTVDAQGNGTLDVTVPGISISGEKNGIVGRAIVVHEKIDDEHTDPSGNSGARIGCGVIKIAP